MLIDCTYFLHNNIYIRDGNEYWKLYSNIRFAYSNIFVFRIRNQYPISGYSECWSFPFPFSNNGNFPSISICLRIYCMFSTYIFEFQVDVNKKQKIHLNPTGQILTASEHSCFDWSIGDERRSQQNFSYINIKYIVYIVLETNSTLCT